MSLSVKNQETHRLAKELAALTGESMTVAVTEAIYERLLRIQREKGVSSVDRMMTIGNHCAAHMKEPWKSIDHGDLLYDALGLPK